MTADQGIRTVPVLPRITSPADLFDSPRDRTVFDTGHHAYVHKILTGRQVGFDRLRQAGGLSGHPSRAESAHDTVRTRTPRPNCPMRTGWRRASRCAASPVDTSPAVTGKPVHPDLRARKKSLPVVAVLNSGTPSRRELATLCTSAEPLSEADIAHAAGLVERGGGRAWSQAEARRLLDDALAVLRPFTSPATAELAVLARRICHRDS